MAKNDRTAANKLSSTGATAAKGPDTKACKTCGGRRLVARDGALGTEVLQADGSWQQDVVPADLVPCPDCGSGYYPAEKPAKASRKK